jgi:hypothetical protein
VYRPLSEAGAFCFSLGGWGFSSSVGMTWALAPEETVAALGLIFLAIYKS